MKKFEVRKIQVETKNGTDALNTFLKGTNQETYLVKEFDNVEDAIEFYKTVDVDLRDMGRYFLHEGKCIEVNEYDVDEDDDREWIGGGDWYDYEIPEIKE